MRVQTHNVLVKATTKAQPFEPAQLAFQELIDVLPQHIFVLAPDGTPLAANQALLDYHGCTLRDIQDEHYRTGLIHPDDLKPWAIDRHAGLLLGLPSETELRLRDTAGRFRWFLTRVTPIRDEQGAIVRWCGSRIDIDDRKHAEDRLQLAIDTIPALVHSALPDGSIDYFNKGWLTYLGASLDDVRDWRWTSKVHPDDIEELLGKWRSALASGEPFEVESRVRRADGEYRWVLHRKVALRDERGNIVRWYGSSIDIEARKSAFEEIRALKERLFKENIVLREEVDKGSMFEEIVGSSESLQRVLAQVARVAPTDSTVLITGETGTGKELVARAIHKRSPRAGRAFVSVNCSAIAPSLISSELFGHEKGAFTGATQRRLGRFELADGGTIFLDEAGELPAETQVALLRVLQERKFERLGGSQTVSVNVRVLAATNRDLNAAIESGAFRKDLFYRLNVFPIPMPPLRERPEDLPLLVRYFAERFGSNMGKRIQTIERKSLDLLRSYSWPGNIRELQNVIERAVILCDGESLSIDASWLQLKSQPSSSDQRVPLGTTLEGREREMIEAALMESRGRVAGPSGAAARLGIPRQTLDSRIKSLGIAKHRFKPG